MKETGMVSALLSTPGWETFGVWVLYLTGNVLHVLLKAQASSQSTLNKLSGIGAYLKLNWVAISSRFFLNTMSFLFVWHSPWLFDLDKLNLAMPARLALAGMLGWFSDSVFDKAILLLSRFFPSLQKEAPPR